MKNKRVITFFVCLFGLVSSFAGNRPGHPKNAPIDTNEIILIVAAVLLTVGVVAYKKLSVKKA